MLALPAMEFLRAEYTEVWVPSAVVPLVRFADRVRSIASTGLDLLGLPEVAAPARLLTDLAGFDSIISWYGSQRPEFRAALPGAVFLDALPPPGGSTHCADFFARQVGAAMPARSRVTVHPVFETRAVLHPFSGSRRKNWPLPRYRELAQRLACPVEWCAGPEESLPEARRFDNLYELATWMAGSRVYVGNDSGITHVAAAAGARVVAIFGPTDPAVWAPRGPHVRILYGQHGQLETISVDEVLHAIDSLSDSGLPFSR